MTKYLKIMIRRSRGLTAIPTYVSHNNVGTE